jgi:hypothetical protein
MCPYWQPSSPRPALVVILLWLLSPGCGEELGPERFPTTRVAGTVVEGGNAVAGGWIEFELPPWLTTQAQRVEFGHGRIRRDQGQD